MKFIRLFWGDINLFNNKYKNQIEERVSEKLDETVFIWGEKNYKIINKLGFKCEIVSKDPYDYNISNNHTFYDHKNLNHKLKGIELACSLFKEVIFLDWDCKKIKEIDDNFYKLLDKGSDLQIPLYVYPKHALSLLIKNSNSEMVSFFIKLKKLIENNSYEFKDNFIIPNTGFIFCRQKEIAKKLWNISIEQNYECVPDEFSAYKYYSKETLDNYIIKIEPQVMGKKEHGYDWWNNEENIFFEYKKKLKEKDIYFVHN